MSATWADGGCFPSPTDEAFAMGCRQVDRSRKPAQPAAEPES
jgi:hypothetical protein